MKKVIKSNIVFRPWQADVIRGVLSKGKGSIHVVKSSRQCGKSVMSESIILKFAVDNKNTFSMYLSPTIKQARKVFKEIVKAINRSPVFLKSNESFLEIVLKNGSTIAFCSAEQGDNLRGYTVSGILIVDEAAYIEDETFNAVLPTTDVFSAPILIVSTPRFRTGFFYDYYMDGVEKVSGVYSYDWALYDKSAILSQERLEFYRKRLPKVKFLQDYLGEFADLGGGVFGITEDTLWKPTNPSSAGCVVGVDWCAGTGGDETAIVVFNENKEMIDLIHFNDLNDIQTIDKVIAIIRKYNARKVEVETNSIGQIFYNMLQRKIGENHLSCVLKGFNTNNTSKQKIVNRLQVAIQNNEVKLLRDEKLIAQLGTFESKLTSAGKVTYAASKSNHDDLVLATLFAYDALVTGSYHVM